MAGLRFPLINASMHAFAVFTGWFHIALHHAAQDMAGKLIENPWR